MTVLITLTTAQTDTGPFDLYTNVDSYVTPFVTNVSRSALLSGYSSALVPDGALVIRVKSKGVCTNYIDITLTHITTTTSSSSSTSTSSTSSTSTSSTSSTTSTSSSSTTTTTLTTLCNARIYNYQSFQCSTCTPIGSGFINNAFDLTIGMYYYNPLINAVIRIISTSGCSITSNTSIVDSTKQSLCTGIVCPSTTTTTSTTVACPSFQYDIDYYTCPDCILQTLPTQIFNNIRIDVINKVYFYKGNAIIIRSTGVCSPTPPDAFLIPENGIDDCGFVCAGPSFPFSFTIEHDDSIGAICVDSNYPLTLYSYTNEMPIGGGYQLFDDAALTIPHSVDTGFRKTLTTGEVLLIDFDGYTTSYGTC